MRKSIALQTWMILPNRAKSSSVGIGHANGLSSSFSTMLRRCNVRSVSVEGGSAMSNVPLSLSSCLKLADQQAGNFLRAEVNGQIADIRGKTIQVSCVDPDWQNVVVPLFLQCSCL